VLVCILIALLPLGAVWGWLEDRESGAVMGALLVPILAFGFWLVVLAVVHGLLWVAA
jgi:hypothetical protein